MVKLKVGRNILDIDENDLILDNGACYQIITKEIGKAFSHYPPVMSKKLFNDLKKCEERIAQLEAKAQELDAEMAKPEVATNVARLQEIAREKAAIEEELNPLYEKWEELSE